MSIREFVVNAETRELTAYTGDKETLMQYDHLSETFTFAVPLEIEGQNMYECDVIQVLYQNVSKGTSVSTRNTSGGIETIWPRNESPDLTKDDLVKIAEDDSGAKYVTFSWVVPQTATAHVGTLKFQLRFIKYDEDGEKSYIWHSAPNSNFSIVGGITCVQEELSPKVLATLQSLEVIEHDEGIIVELDGRPYTINHGYSGVYVGDDEEAWPPNANVWINPNGNVSIDDTGLTQTIDESSSEIAIPSAKAVYTLFDEYAGEINALLETIIDGEATT